MLPKQYGNEKGENQWWLVVGFNGGESGVLH
jgi:hypothetical protein